MMKLLRMMILKNKILNLNSRQKFVCLLLFSFILLSSCVNKFVPVQQPGLLLSDDYAIWKSQDLILTISEQMWDKDPQFLSDHYTCFWIKLQNNSTSVLPVSIKDFAILDEHRNQVDAQNPDLVLDLMLQDESLYIDRFLMSLENQQDRAQKRSQIQRNIALFAFPFGEILPRASKQGYLFFPHIDYKTKEIVFVYKNKEIIFRRIK